MQKEKKKQTKLKGNAAVSDWQVPEAYIFCVISKEIYIVLMILSHLKKLVFSHRKLTT